MHVRFWLTRLYLCLSVLVSAVVGAASSHEAFSLHNLGGAAATTLLLWFCAVGLIDTIGHDLMGRRECLFKKLRRFRFLWLMSMATGLIALTLENARWGMVDSEMLRYVLDAILASVLAALDIQVRRAAT